MYPVLVDLGFIKLYAYGFMIMLGMFLGFFYLKPVGARYGLNADKVSELFLWSMVGVIVGGKLFYILEDPAYHLSNLGDLFRNFGQGFVFYGSFLCTIPILIWWFKKHKLDIWNMMDHLGIVGGLVHGFGKIGCLLAGCCHGKVCAEGDWGIVFSNPKSMAVPLGKALYPTQLWDAILVLGIVLLMYAMRNKKLFNGQMFLTYGAFYAIGRFITEKYRGDESRGFVTFGGILPDKWISHSQFIAIGILLICTIVALWRYKNRRLV